MPAFRHLVTLFILCFILPLTVSGAILPPGFAEVVLAEGLNPMDMKVTPDGRLFLAQKDVGIGNLPAGLYSILLDNNETATTKRFIKLQDFYAIQ